MATGATVRGLKLARLAVRDNPLLSTAVVFTRMAAMMATKIPSVYSSILGPLPPVGFRFIALVIALHPTSNPGDAGGASQRRRPSL